MRPRSALLAILLTLSLYGLLHAQKPWRQYRGERGGIVPPDYEVPHEWVTARLMYRDFGRFGGFGSRGAWATDYPQGDRHLIEGVRRLSLIDVRSVEQPVEIDGSDDVYNWPFLYAVEVGQWTINEEEGAQLREFLLRGGFLMTDDFHGAYEWEAFEEGLRTIFPDRPIEDIPHDDPIFRTLSEIDPNVQVAGVVALNRGVTYEADGYNPTWRAVRDDRGRIMVAICHNMDLGDAWEHSDNPYYPADMAGVAHRVLVNFAAYDLTH